MTDEVADLFLALAVASISKFADIFEGVVGPDATELFDLTDHEAEAVVVLDVAVVLGDVAEVLGEEAIDEAAMINLLLELLVSLRSSLLHDSLGEHVKHVVAGIDVVLGAAWLLSEDHLLHLVVLAEHELSVGLLLGLSLDALEVTDGLPEEVSGAKGLDRGGSGELDNGRLLIEESLGIGVVGLSVLHPVDGEQITEA